MRLAAPLVDKVALVTGASGGIGATIARALGSVGARLVLTGRTGARLERTVGMLEACGMDRTRMVQVSADLREPSAGGAVVQAALDHFGGVDLLVHCAGAGQFTPFHELTVEQIQDTLAVNLLSAMTMTRHAMPHLMARRGHVVMLASGLARRASGKATVYSAASHGLRGFCEGLRLESARHGVRVSLVTAAGAGVDTGFWQTASQDVPHEGMMSPERVAEVVLVVLTSRESALIDDVNVRTG